MPFLSKPDFHQLDDNRLQLDSPLVYIDKRGTRWVIPTGFTTDLASVPKIVPGFIRIFFGDKLETASAAILHDCLYSSQRISRREADNLFYEALRDLNQSRIGAFIPWLGVRLGGWWAWWRSK